MSPRRSWPSAEIKDRLRRGKRLPPRDDLVFGEGHIERDGRIEPGGWVLSIASYVQLLEEARQ
jgi:hypothetical protein